MDYRDFIIPILILVIGLAIAPLLSMQSCQTASGITTIFKGDRL